MNTRPLIVSLREICLSGARWASWKVVAQIFANTDLDLCQPFGSVGEARGSLFHVLWSVLDGRSVPW